MNLKKLQKYNPICCGFTMAPTLVGPWSCGHPVGSLTDCFIEQTRTNMFQAGRWPGTAVGDERHVLQALWIRKGI